VIHDWICVVEMSSSEVGYLWLLVCQPQEKLSPKAASTDWDYPDTGEDPD